MLTLEPGEDKALADSQTGRGGRLVPLDDVFLTAWNRNQSPGWLLLLQGVSGAIKYRGGTQAFREVARRGSMPLGSAQLTSAGKLPFKGIIHVAGINLLWRTSERAVRDSTRNSLGLAAYESFESIGFPIIGAGSGGGKQQRCLSWMQDEISKHTYHGRVLIVEYRR